MSVKIHQLLRQIISFVDGKSKYFCREFIVQLAYQTRIYPTEDHANKLVEAMLSVGRFYHFCFNNFWFNKGLSYLELKNKTFCSQYQLGTKQANSLIREAKAKVELYREMCNYTENTLTSKWRTLDKETEKLIRLADKIEDLKGKFPKQRKPKNEENPFKLTYEYYLTCDKAGRKQFYRQLKSSIWHNKRRLAKLEKKLRKFRHPSITFGSKDNQRKLIKGKMSIEKWREIRHNFIFGLGEGDVSYGNNTIKIISQDELQVEVLNLEKLTLNCRLRNKHYQKVLGEGEATGTKRTARLLRRGNKFYLQSILDYSQEESQIKRDVGAITSSERHYCGIDLNDGFFSVYSPSVWQNYHYDAQFKDYNSNQREQNLRQLIKQMFEDIKQDKIHVVRIEDLDFMKKKHQNLGKSMNKLLHELPYGQFRKIIESECFRHHMVVEYINPAYSSQKALKLGLDRHLGAAKIIAEGNVGAFEFKQSLKNKEKNE